MYKKWLKRICSVFTISLLLCILFSVSNSFAANYIELSTCDVNGNIGPGDKTITQASITISGPDNSGNFNYYGVDIGIFGLPSNNIVYTKRIPTSNFNFTIDSFGDLTQYQSGKVYAIGYRILYQPIGIYSTAPIESDWRMTPNSYFKVVPAKIFVTCADGSAGTIRPSDTAFAQANIAISGSDNSGNFNYYGADIGVFQKPTDNTLNVVYIKRIPTRNRNFQITDFGDLSQYENNQIYVFGYRLLYQPVGDSSQNIIEGSWQVVPNNYFRLLPKELKHLQTINYMYNYQFKPIDVTGPDKSGLQGDELDSYNTSNFATEEDLLTYKVKFYLGDLSKLNNPNVNLLFNTSWLNDPDVELDNTSWLDIQSDPDIELVLSSAQMNGNNIDVTNSRQEKNNYVLTIPTSRLVTGENCLIYKARVKVHHYTRIFVNIINSATITEINTDGTTLQIGSPFSSSSYIETKVFKGEVRYH